MDSLTVSYFFFMQRNWNASNKVYNALKNAIPEDGILHSHRCENLKVYNALLRTFLSPCCCTCTIKPGTSDVTEPDIGTNMTQDVPF
jgi:hypothetical protein